MTRVLLVSPLPPPEGGIATWTRTLLDRGLPDGIELKVINTRVTRSHFSSPARPTPTEILRSWKILTSVRSAARSGRFDVMHLNHGAISSNGMFRDYLVARIAHRAGLPYVVQLHGNLDLSWNRGLIGKRRLSAYKGMFQRSSTVLSLNTQTRDAVLTLEPEVGDRCQMIPNFIVSEEMPRWKSDPGAQNRPLQILFVGSMIETKGIATILEVIRRIKGVELTLVGPSPGERERRYLENFQAPDLSNRVTISGSLPNKDVLKIMSESDLYLFPSHTEGFPISVLEAMSVGLPVVASTVGAIPDMIDVPGGGVLCEAGDTESFVAAIEKLRDSPEQRREMGQHNRDKALREYDYGSVSRRLADLYQSIAAN
jgi:glycosyltransferase involved in cell wall biosynthesis